MRRATGHLNHDRGDPFAFDRGTPPNREGRDLD